MKSLLLLLALVAVARADALPHEGPCGDVDACEAACKKNKPGTCFYGGVLVLQTVKEDRDPRAQKLFDRACTKGDGEACWQSARIVDRNDTAEGTTRAKTRTAYQKACTRNHARACFAYAQTFERAEDPKSKKLAVDAQKKGLSLLEQRCVKSKLAPACDWASNLYAGTSWQPQNPKKAEDLHQRSCKIRMGAACPPPPPPPAPAMTKQATRPD